MAAFTIQAFHFISRTETISLSHDRENLLHVRHAVFRFLEIVWPNFVFAFGFWVSWSNESLRTYWIFREIQVFWSSSVATNLLVLTSSETKFIVGSDFATILSSPSCSCILFAIVSMQLVKLKFWEQQRKLKWLMLNKWRRLFHLSCVQLPLVRTVGVWCRHTWFEFLGPN